MAISPRSKQQREQQPGAAVPAVCPSRRRNDQHQARELQDRATSQRSSARVSACREDGLERTINTAPRLHHWPGSIKIYARPSRKRPAQLVDSSWDLARPENPI